MKNVFVAVVADEVLVVKASVLLAKATAAECVLSTEKIGTADSWRPYTVSRGTGEGTTLGVLLIGNMGTDDSWRPFTVRSGRGKLGTGTMLPVLSTIVWPAPARSCSVLLMNVGPMAGAALEAGSATAEPS